VSPDPYRLILWAPVALAIGAAAYFSWPSEPGLLPALTGLVLCLLAAIAWMVRRDAVTLYALVLLACLTLGFTLARDRAHGLGAPELEAFQTERSAEITGWIERVERLEGRARLVIRVQALDHADTPPERVRIRAGLGGFEPGDAIRVRARLSPPSAPVAAGGYDPARAAWFDQIALTGYAISDLEAADIASSAPLSLSLARLRWRLSERLQAQTGERTGAVAAALLTGERARVSNEDAEALRLSGLGHILAISGLHMALFAGGAYWLIRLGFAMWEPWARAHDPRKPAAIGALIAASLYLVISGAAVSTQRAYIMAFVVLVGVLFDRQAFSMRSLALAAILILVIAPESVIEPGFQMSFSAVAALIASFDAYKRWRPEGGYSTTLIGKVKDALAGLSATSLIAGAATGAFAIFHFQRMAAYGLIANLLAMPLFTFWVMPAGGAALIFSTVGLERPFLWIMDQGLRRVLDIAHWASTLDGAVVGANAADPALVALYGLGFACLVIGLGWMRVAGGALILVAMGLFMIQTPPQMMITDGGVVLARFEGGGEAFTVTDRRRGRFDARVFLQRAGVSASPERAALSCDSLGCTGRTAEGLLLAVTASSEALEDDCEQADLIVFDGEVSAWRKRRCRALVLDDPARAELGGMEFWVHDGQVIRMRSAQQMRRDRLWGRSSET
jgi:competence protein ComEC